MADFYVEKKATETGAHLIHKASCPALPALGAMHYMGSYAQAPVWEAMIRYPQVATCPQCVAA